MFKKILFLILISASAFLLAGIVMADETDPDADYPWRAHADPFSFKFGNKIDSHQQSRIVDGGKLQGFLYIHNTGDTTDDELPVAEPAKCPHMEDCRVGWILKGVPISATLVNKSPRVWLVDESLLPDEKDYNHFHWLGEPKSPHCLEINETYSGILLKRIAPAPFFWLGGSGGSGGGGSGGHDGGDAGGCDGGDTGGCDSGSTGGCDSGSTGGCDSGSTGGCDGGSTGDTGDCTGHDTGDTGGCDSGSAGDCDSGSTGDTGGCTGHDSGDTGGCTGHDTGDTGGCGGSGGMGGSGGHGGRIVPEGVDSHTNIVTFWDGTWSGGGCDGHDGGDSGGCTGHDGGDTGGCDGGDTGGCDGDTGDSGGCTGHDSGDTGSDPGGCSGTDGGSCTG